MTKKKKIGGTRKVIRIGGSLAITLPPEFTESHNIKEGDEIGFLSDLNTHILKLDLMKEGESNQIRQAYYSPFTPTNIVSSYPSTFEKCFEFSIGEGWFPLVENLTKKLLSIYPNLEVIQVKEKFGILRYYYGSVPKDLLDEIDNIVDKTTKSSSKTCEICGKVGNLINKDGWYRTRCLEHSEIHV